MSLVSQIPSAVDDEVASLSRTRKAELGQFFTPENVAAFMAQQFPAADLQCIRLLDAGAGEGALTRAFFNRVQAGAFGAPIVSAVAYEIDPVVQPSLRMNLSNVGNASIELRTQDFIERAVQNIADGDAQFTHAILNPPYKKLPSRSVHKSILRRAGIEAVNLYAAFVSLALLSLQRGGHLCAILPRSFCNGPYYRPFRDLILREAALLSMHIFDSRTEAFGDDDVLQENVIIHLARGAKQGSVTLSRSTDSTFGDLVNRQVPFEEIVWAGDSERMFRIPSSEQRLIPSSFSSSLADLGLRVSTGPVVDFRLKEFLRHAPGTDTVPLIYPAHFSEVGLRWPYGNPKKPSAIVDCDATRKWLYPAGNYTVVRRLSSKEERKRIVARLVCADRINSDRIGFENHLNVFHSERTGMSKELAFGLMAYLNWSVVDAHFRSFNGHTQVNATDLRAIAYPNREILTEIGAWAGRTESLTQQAIDNYLADRV